MYMSRAERGQRTVWQPAHLSADGWQGRGQKKTKPGPAGLASQQRIVATVEDSVLRTEMAGLESQEEDAPKRLLFFKPMSWLGQIRPHRNFAARRSRLKGRANTKKVRISSQRKNKSQLPNYIDFCCSKVSKETTIRSVQELSRVVVCRWLTKPLCCWLTKPLCCWLTKPLCCEELSYAVII
jgi:hypothetical protein